jgi:ribosome-associated heat shock protein Hsp15
LQQDRQRIDKWLWHARVVRTRQAAAELAARGHVRVNGERIAAASRAVKPGDVVTVALDRSVRVMKVLAFAERRGASEAARALFEDLSAPAPPAGAEHAAHVPRREPGAGRPSKQESRALDRMRRPEDD